MNRFIILTVTVRNNRYPMKKTGSRCVGIQTLKNENKTKAVEESSPSGEAVYPPRSLISPSPRQNRHLKDKIK
jgi:hypothetical protein